MYNVVAGRNILPRGQQRGWFSPNFFYYWTQNGAFSGHLRVSKKAWPGTILITWVNKVWMQH
jgi:hypothetical protein